MKLSLCLFALLISNGTVAQISSLTSPPNQQSYSANQRESFVQDLKSSTTVFVLQYDDYKQLPLFDSAIKQSWTYTPYVIVTPQQLMSYKDKEGYSFFSLGGYYTGSYDEVPHLCYDLWYPIPNKKGGVKKQFFFSRTLLYTQQWPSSSLKEYVSGKNKYDLAPVNIAQNNNHIYNWSPQLLKGYLRTVNNMLATKTIQHINEDFLTDGTGLLRNDTLYIPDYNILNSEPGLADDEPGVTETTAREVYPYPVRFVSFEQLELLLASNARNINYLVFVRDGRNKYISVFSSKNGLIYSSYNTLSVHLKNKDLERLAKVVAS